MFLTQIKKSDKGGFSISVHEDGIDITTTIEQAPKWIYEQFSQMENLIKLRVKPQEADLKGFKVKETKNDTIATFEIFTRIGGIHSEAKFEINDFVNKTDIYTDLDSQQVTEILKEIGTKNAIIERYQNFSTEVQLNFDELINTQKQQLEIFNT